MPKFSATRSLFPEYTLVVPQFSEGLLFESKFENGNLKKAIRVSRDEYNLILDEDHNTKGHTQWFYFKATSHLPPSNNNIF